MFSDYRDIFVELQKMNKIKENYLCVICIKRKKCLNGGINDNKSSY